MEIILSQNKLILADIDEFSSELNIHKEFVTNSNVRKTYFLLTWYFNSNNLKEYFKKFIDNIIECFGSENIEEITSTVEKSSELHIHCVIMFKRASYIYGKINKLYKDINIEVINCAYYEKIKLYCSKEFTKESNCILWKKDFIINEVATIQKSKLNEKEIFDKIYIKLLIKKLKTLASESFIAFEKKLAKKGIVLSDADYIEELYRYLKEGEARFLDVNYVCNQKALDLYVIKVAELDDIIKMLHLNITNLKNENSELHKSNCELTTQVYNLNKNNPGTYYNTLDLVKEENKLLKLQISKMQEEFDRMKKENTETKEENESLKLQISEMQVEPKQKSNREENNSKYEQENNTEPTQEDNTETKQEEHNNQDDNEYSYQELFEKFTELQVLYDSVNFQFEELEEKYCAVKISYDEQKEELKKASEPKSKCSNAKYVNLVEKYDKLLDKNTNDKIKHNDIIDVLKSKHDNIIDVLKSKHDNIIDNLKSKYIEVINTKELLIEQLKTKHLEDINNKELLIEQLKTKHLNDINNKELYIEQLKTKHLEDINKLKMF